MDNLYKKIKKILSLEGAIKIEQSDVQFQALKGLYENIENKKIYLSLIIANSIICYQLSRKGEDYWKEFSLEGAKFKLEKPGDVIDFFVDFLPRSKGNKRLLDIKINRLHRLKPFLEQFIGKEKYYYDNMTELRDLLAKTMNQSKQAKTIVFSVKMFSYGARNYFGELIEFPLDISIPVDSRLEKLFEKYKGDYTDINVFYQDLSEKIKIAPLLLDAIIWVNYNELIS